MLTALTFKFYHPLWIWAEHSFFYTKMIKDNLQKKKIADQRQRNHREMQWRILLIFCHYSEALEKKVVLIKWLMDADFQCCADKVLLSFQEWVVFIWIVVILLCICLSFMFVKRWITSIYWLDGSRKEEKMEHRKRASECVTSRYRNEQLLLHVSWFIHTTTQHNKYIYVYENGP